MVCSVLGGIELGETVVDANMFARRISYVRLYVSRRASGVSVAGFCSDVIKSCDAAASMFVVASVGIRKLVGSQSTVSLFHVAIVLTTQHL